MVLTTTGFTPFTGRVGELTRVSPFTHRDNETFLGILTGIVNYLKEGGTLHAELETELQRIITEFNDGLNIWDARFDALMLALIDQIQELNEAAFHPRVQATTVYVNPASGLDTNAGTLAAPYRTVNKAIERAEYGAQNADTAFVIELAPGSYNERITSSDFTPFALNITIQGPFVPHPATPLVVFTEGLGISAAAIKVENPNLDLTVNYVKFVGYNGTTSSAGINSAQGRLFTNNVHAELCFYGVSSVRGQIDVKGGIFDNCGRTNAGTGNGGGIRSLMLNRHSIGTQGAGNLNAGPIFRNCRYGVYAQESATGHIDWCTFEDNETGVVLRVNSRGNLDGSSFARNQTDVAADGGAHAYISDAVTFGTGVNKSGETIRLTAGSNATTSRAVDGSDLAYARGEYALEGTYTAQSVTGTTATTNVGEYILKAPWWNDTRRISGTPVKRLKLRAAGSMTGAAGTKQITLRMGSKTASVTFSATEEGTFVYEGVVLFAAPDRQVITIASARHLADTPRNTVTTTAQDMSIDQDLLLQVTLGSASDTVTFEYIELIHG